jgi:hypothetical protein
MNINAWSDWKVILEKQLVAAIRDRSGEIYGNTDSKNYAFGAITAFLVSSGPDVLY